MNPTGQTTTTTIQLDRVLERPYFNSRRCRIDVSELAQSIAEIGVLYPPLVVRATDRPPISDSEFYYYIVHGHRRVRAMQALNWTHGQFFVAPPDFPISEQYIINLAENVRENLTPGEIAERCCQIADGAKRAGQEITSEQLGKRIGYSVSHVRNLMRLRRQLHPELWDMMLDRGHGAPITLLLTVVTKPVHEQLDAWKPVGQMLKEAGGIDTLPRSPKKKSWRTIAAELVKQAPPEHASGARWLFQELGARLTRAEIDRALS
jgi:ParB/RepB/Spo0J family partition protein